MKTLTLIFALHLFSYGCLGQQGQVNENATKPSAQIEIMTSLGNYRNLAISQINSPIGRAIALVEIGRVTWSVDKEDAKRSFREAYRFTLSSGRENDRQQSATDRARAIREGIIKNDIRHRIFEVVRLDKEFKTELFGSQSDQWERSYSFETYGDLVAKAIEDGSKQSATELMLSLQDISPFSVAGMDGLVKEIARTDPALADSLIIQMLERLQLDRKNPKEMAVIVLGLSRMIEPDSVGRKSAPWPNSIVIRAYLNFVTSYFNYGAHSDDNFLKRNRSYILRAGELSTRYAQDLLPRFMSLEQLSRSSHDKAWTPDLSTASRGASQNGEESDTTSEQKIVSLISRGELSKAREAISQIKDSSVRVALLDRTYEEEARQLIKKGDFLSAEKPALEISQASTFVVVYELLIRGHVAQGNLSRATELVSTVVLRLSKAEASLPIGDKAAPSGASPSVMVSYDPSLSSLNAFLNVTSAIDERLGLQVVDAVVTAANRSKLDTSLGLTGLDYEAFKKLSVNNEERIRQAALTLTDPLRRLVLLIKLDEVKLGNVKNKRDAKPVAVSN